MITVSVTVENANNWKGIWNGISSDGNVRVGGYECSFMNALNGFRPLSQVHCRLEIPTRLAVNADGQIGPIAIYFRQDLSATADAWVVLCGQNYQEGKFFFNGVEYDQSAGSLPDSLQLTINDMGWDPGSNYGYFLESSDWALSEVAIWRGALRADELRAVSSHFMQKLSAGSSAPYNHTLNVSCGSSTAAMNKMSPYVSDLGCFFSSQVYQSTCDASMFGASRGATGQLGTARLVPPSARRELEAAWRV
ncbi:hypothetical protein GUITHDRAFT_135475 [Guillardia theta CCMP2712]|uniref:Uncharacterized protein n=1 Tax=Guillardia theta (strain CCMP2712) TaxID=905079 RepID=L1JQ87_GUITC|nr:hypothetical protein GUITHDRAFT_135475 [Guillardia theta CCMP2712]EKX50330.1 hypothetical protein GUITHDRAFT_135475 [Guillardia theta CCMP2712]|eukprot:XP_005837310.1 hypothetical protein GUITHDRAFT_135475 [Guillardia theta CCMP2712]